MFPLLVQAPGLRTVSSFNYLSSLINSCFSSKSPTLLKSIHAQLVKHGFNRNTFLGNRCVELYFSSGSKNDALKLFDEIPDKNTISWNICLKGLLNAGDFGEALYLFDEMSERDVVSWNSMISGAASCGFSGYAMRAFADMQKVGMRPSEYTFGILTSLASCARQGKEIHGGMIRRGVSFFNTVVWNSLIDMYGNFGLVDYGFGVFMIMEELDTVSWNSLISCCFKSGNEELSLTQFYLMRSMGYDADEYTFSMVMTVCSDLRDLDKGKQVFALCVKMGFLSNTIVSSATIDMFSKCGRLEDSVCLFKELDCWDSALCNSIISSYAWHGFAEDALRLFVLALRQDLRTNGFTFSSVVSSISVLMLDQGSQLHCLSIKSGFESDPIVANSLAELYNKIGLADSAIKLFVGMDVRDLISWNTMIIGLARNGRAAESLKIFHQLIKRGLLPDRLTFFGVLLACSNGGFMDEGIRIFSSMEKVYGVKIDNEHYACVVDMLCRACLLKEAMYIVENMPFEPNSLVLEPLLCASVIHGDLKLAETVAKRMIDLEPGSVMAYSVLAKVYEITYCWEDIVRVRYAMNRNMVKRVRGCSQIGIKNNVYSFKADQLQHHKGDHVYSILRLLKWESEENKAHFFQDHKEIF